MWPLHFKPSHWLKRRSQLKFAWETNIVCECKMNVKYVYIFLYGIKRIMFHGHLTCFQKPRLGGRPNTEPGDHDGIPNAHNHWYIIFYHVQIPAWIDFHWVSIWLRVQSHMTSHYTLRLVTTLHDFDMAVGHFLLGSHNFTVTALGSCVKWPLEWTWHFETSRHLG
jgi:hypothetical protein